MKSTLKMFVFLFFGIATATNLHAIDTGTGVGVKVPVQAAIKNPAAAKTPTDISHRPVGLPTVSQKVCYYDGYNAFVIGIPGVKAFLSKLTATRERVDTVVEISDAAGCVTFSLKPGAYELISAKEGYLMEPGSFSIVTSFPIASGTLSLPLLPCLAFNEMCSEARAARDEYCSTGTHSTVNLPITIFDEGSAAVSGASFQFSYFNDPSNRYYCTYGNVVADGTGQAIVLPDIVDLRASYVPDFYLKAIISKEGYFPYLIESLPRGAMPSVRLKAIR